ncbi:MAG: hypothetical protein ACE3JQ_09900 [Paenisporosarcina sp.]
MDKKAFFTIITIGLIIILFFGVDAVDNLKTDTNYEEDETSTYEETESTYTEAELESDPAAPLLILTIMIAKVSMYLKMDNLIMQRIIMQTVNINLLKT